ncbi:MAG: hypothetical protein GXO63_00935 [Candidatus Micrarchaeota archaeon]|nr:hypothetical protein [Candidatus Micrarchaeota archaeon]
MKYWPLYENVDKETSPEAVRLLEELLGTLDEKIKTIRKPQVREKLKNCKECVAAVYLSVLPHYARYISELQHQLLFYVSRLNEEIDPRELEVMKKPVKTVLEGIKRLSALGWYSEDEMRNMEEYVDLISPLIDRNDPSFRGLLLQVDPNLN